MRPTPSDSWVANVVASDALWITGVGGFTGRHLVDYLRAEHPELALVGLDIRRPEWAEELDAFSAEPLDQFDSLAAMANEHSPRWVIHLAGVIPPAEPDLMQAVNVDLAAAFLEHVATLAPALSGFVAIGSAAEYGPQDSATPMPESKPGAPQDPYGRSKLAATEVLLRRGEELGVPVTIARPFNLVGPGCPTSLVLARVCDQIRQANGDIETGPLDSMRDFIDVRDAVSAYAALALEHAPAGIYNVCSGVGVVIRDAVELARRVAGSSQSVDEFRPEGYQPDYSVGSNAKLTDAVGWRCRFDLSASIADMLKS